MVTEIDRIVDAHVHLWDPDRTDMYPYLTGLRDLKMGDNQVTLTYIFKQDGEKLTGSVTGPQGNPLELNDGKVQGDKVSFFVQVSGPNGTFKIKSDGTIKEETITIATTMEGVDMPGGGMPPMTLKRSK